MRELLRSLFSVLTGIPLFFYLAFALLTEPECQASVYDEQYIIESIKSSWDNFRELDTAEEILSHLDSTFVQMIESDLMNQSIDSTIPQTMREYLPPEPDRDMMVKLFVTRSLSPSNWGEDGILPSSGSIYRVIVFDRTWAKVFFKDSEGDERNLIMIDYEDNFFVEEWRILPYE